MKIVALVVTISLSLVSCKTIQPNKSELLNEPVVTSQAWLEAWQQHIQTETRGAKIQADCMPRYYPASKPTKGMVMFFHGFTACPQQYFDIGERLSAMGYDVFLPLSPGHGREPFDGPAGDKDNFSDLPSTMHSHEYVDGQEDNRRWVEFVDSMNEIASKHPGPRYLAGLSGGGALATGAVLGDKNALWDRLLLYAPYYKNPGLSGVASAVLDQVMPGFVNDWGPECRETRRGDAGRAGLCALTIGSVRAMSNYGVNASKRANEIKIPVQIVGVESDPTADNGRIYEVYKMLAGKKSICLYPKGVPHSIINPRSDAPKLDPYWVDAMSRDSINFLTEGSFFIHSQKKASTSDYSLALCRTELSAEEQVD